MRVFYSQEKKDEARQLLQKGGMTYKEIAAAIGSSEQFVARFAKSNGMSRRDGWTGEKNIPVKPPVEIPVEIEEEKPEFREIDKNSTRFVIKRSGVFFDTPFPDGCKFPVQVEGDRHRWCNAPSEGLTYCENHMKKAYVKLTDSQKRRYYSGVTMKVTGHDRVKR